MKRTTSKTEQETEAKKLKMMEEEEEEELENLIFGESKNNVKSSLALAGQELNEIEAEKDLLFYIDTGVEEEESEEEEEEALAPAWRDDDDELGKVDIQSSNRLRKLKTDFDETAIQGSEYEERLRSQFERINPTPSWAQVSQEEEEKDAIFGTTKPLVKKAPSLNPDKVVMIRLKDANHKEYSQVIASDILWY